MATEPKTLLAFNRGVISSRGLARVDLDRMAMSAEIQSNFMPRVLGSMMLRPGLGFLSRMANDTLPDGGRLLPFTFGVDDQALIELSTAEMQVRDPLTDTLITRPGGTTAIFTNPTFVSDISGWTDASDAGGTAAFVSPDAGVKGDGTDFGKLRQTITVPGGEINIEHWLHIIINNGPARFRCGKTAGDDDLVAETLLDEGHHHLAFTPVGDFTVEFSNERQFNVLIAKCDLENTAGPLTVVTPWNLNAEFAALRWEQSGDVIYVSCDPGASDTGVGQRKIERRGDGRSWSVVKYLPENGPFRVQNVSGITLTPSALNGDITITASQPIFKTEHANEKGLWRIASAGQTVTKAISGADDFADPIRVTGSDGARVFSLIIEGTFVATVTLQFAFTADGPWNDNAPQYSSPISTSFDDGQDGQVIYYRLGVKAGDFTSGTVTCTLNYTGGSIQGVARTTGFSSATVINAAVLNDFGAITASKDWWEGEWSRFRGYPSAVSLHEGRLWWAGKDKIFGSVSDAYEDFDDNTVGDSRPISRSVGFGPIRVIHWLLSMGRLLMGTSETSANVAAVKMDGNNPLGVRSNTFDEPLTVTNFNIKTISSKGIFVDRTKQRLYELIYDLNRQDYESLDLSVFAPDFNVAGIVQIAVQMKPDIRIHCVRTDGTVGMLVYDRLENVICWHEISSLGASGKVRDVAVLPGIVEDQVYYIVERTINGGVQRHICKWALESEAIGGNVNKIADSFAVYSGAATVTPFTTELLHLRDESVVVWADGKDVGPLTVSSLGGLTIAVAASDVVAGLGYTAQFKSSKLGDIVGIGLLERKMVQRIGFIAENMHYQGLQYGPEFNNLYDLPLVEQGQETPADTVHAEYHEDNFSFGGEWKTDSRICLQAKAPRPVTILAAIAEIKSLEKVSSDSRRRNRS